MTTATYNNMVKSTITGEKPSLEILYSTQLNKDY